VVRTLSEKYPVQALCEIGHINRSSYYKWVHRKETELEKENRKLIKEIKVIYEEHDGTFGYRQMTLHLNRKLKKHYNKKRIYRLMKLVGLQSVVRRKKKWVHRPSDNNVADNILNRDFTAENPNEKWVTDITELKYGNGQKAYLSAVKDLCDHSIVGFKFSHHNNNPLVINTMKAALESVKNSEGLLIHSDRGFQYTSNDFKDIVDQNHLVHSMSRVGRCIDNAPMESFWSTLKVERYYLHHYNTFEELVEDLTAYIHYYNEERLQAKFNGLSPIEYRTKAIA
jgi:transposase InsO family protein